MTCDIDAQWDSALFLLRVTEEHSLSYEGVASLCNSVQSFTEKVSQTIEEKVERILSSNIGSALDEGMKEEILDACKPGDLFEGLTARHSRELYYEAHLNYKVSYLLLLSCSFNGMQQFEHVLSCVHYKHVLP